MSGFLARALDDEWMSPRAMFLRMVEEKVVDSAQVATPTEVLNQAASCLLLIGMNPKDPGFGVFDFRPAQRFLDRFPLPYK